ncbi:hypothetical protein [Massilia sp. CCM 8734]|uniref:hypothetical protein n=1 Tax=Massilia sp. CCM 8734 TaxID=2609283 RepID=UPI00142256D5|nr:hypothetical protein [Massilia sp. CCM 8734]NHZ94535.1 hypothetical protein [Massilia sp. CCM 8734]
MATKTGIEYRGYFIYADAMPTADAHFSAEAQVAGPSGFINFAALGTFKTDAEATDHATRWVQEWIDSGIAEQALAEAFNKYTPIQMKKW